MITTGTSCNKSRSHLLFHNQNCTFSTLSIGLVPNVCCYTVIDVNRLNVCYGIVVEELSARFDVAVIGTDKLNETLSVMLHLASDVSSLIAFNCIKWSSLLLMLSW